MNLSDLHLVVDPSGLPQGYVWLRFTVGDQPWLVSILRSDVDGFAQQSLRREEQDALVARNLDTLAPVIEEKRDRGWLSQQPLASGATVPTIPLTRMDLEQGMRRYPVSSIASTPTEWTPEQAGYMPVLRAGPSLDPVGQPTTPLPLRATPQQPPQPQQPVMSPGIVGTEPGPRAGTTAASIPVQSYLVITPLSFPDATLVSLTIRFDDRLHNLISDPLADALAEASVEGWERVPLATGDELLGRLATTDLANPLLRTAIIEALEDRVAVLRFSLPEPLRLADLQRLRHNIVGFYKTGPRQVFVGTILIGASIIALNVAWGVGSGLRVTSEYAVTEIGRALVDGVAQHLRSDLTAPR